MQKPPETSGLVCTQSLLSVPARQRQRESSKALWMQVRISNRVSSNGLASPCLKCLVWPVMNKRSDSEFSKLGLEGTLFGSKQGQL